jgi:hypothetical protein
MSQHPYKQAQRVFVIVDNGSAHRGKASIDRLQGAYKNLILVHTPVHASWLNQAEIYFSVVQRKVLTPNDFPNLDALEERLLAFGRRYEQIAAPVPMEVHARRPRPTQPPTRSTSSRPGRLTHEYVGELPSQSTKPPGPAWTGAVEQTWAPRRPSGSPRRPSDPSEETDLIAPGAQEEAGAPEERDERTGILPPSGHARQRIAQPPSLSKSRRTTLCGLSAVGGWPLPGLLGPEFKGVHDLPVGFDFAGFQFGEP